MKNKIIIAVLITAAAVGGAGFFGGIKYQENKGSDLTQEFAQGEKSEKMGQKMGLTAEGGEYKPVNGTIIDKDENTITVEMADGSSKIIVFSDSTVFNETQEAAKEDLEVGKNITAFGTENSDGSVTANNVQLKSKLRNLPETTAE